MVIKVRSIFTGHDNSEGNKVRDRLGEVIGFKRSENTVRVAFGIEKLWTPSNANIIEILNQICICEDKKYPNGLGRNMIFLKHIYPLFKTYLDGCGFKPNPNELEFAQKEGRINDS